MKRLILGSLGTLLIATSAPAVAHEVVANSPVRNSNSNIVEVQPFNLVSLAYQGYFTQQGIPSNGALINAIRHRRVKAQDLVEAAIAQGRLSPETVNDQGYIHAVRSQFQSFNRN